MISNQPTTNEINQSTLATLQMLERDAAREVMQALGSRFQEPAGLNALEALQNKLSQIDVRAAWAAPYRRVFDSLMVLLVAEQDELDNRMLANNSEELKMELH